ncbi:hypothetical protein [Marinicellulosiphila megalodicopiae]|uniref:hypothetical protein n=1 Tax=Marinicellulosiphila megalodicopiae TaxID=2724896 RepID=UPI003BB13F89
MNKKLGLSILTLSVATAFSSCLPVEEEEMENNTNTSLTYDQLLATVGQDIRMNLGCTDSGCHANGETIPALTFSSTTDSAIESSIASYISSDFSGNSALIKSKPAGTAHIGGNIWNDFASSKTNYEDLVEQISENVLDDMTTSVTTLVNASNCTTCHNTADNGLSGDATLAFGATATNASVTTTLQSAINSSSRDISTYPTNPDHGGDGYFTWDSADQATWANLVNAL